jgi:hypothetical protein
MLKSYWQYIAPEIAHDVDIRALCEKGTVEALNSERCRNDKGEVGLAN